MYPPLLTVPLVFYILALTRGAPYQPHIVKVAQQFGAPQMKHLGELALRHGSDTIPLGFGQKYTWSDPQRGAERFEDRISIWSSVSSTCKVL